MLIFTGARVSQIRDLKWTGVKPPRLMLPASTTGLAAFHNREPVFRRRCACLMRIEDVADTLDLALVASGGVSANVHPRPRQLSNNGPGLIARELTD